MEQNSMSNMWRSQVTFHLLPLHQAINTSKLNARSMSFCIQKGGDVEPKSEGSLFIIRGEKVSIIVKHNRLINEKSPYLLQHAYNSVEWFAWGDEAFEKANEEYKPIGGTVGQGKE